MGKSHKWSTPEERAALLRLVSEGWSIASAAERLGRSHDWGYKVVQTKGVPKSQTVLCPEPKTLDELDGGVKDTLFDFNLFRETFFARRPVPWVKDAADRIVAMLADTERDDFVDLNCPPGSGKTTLMHDLTVWLICGGGVGDPALGRAIRVMLGHRTKDKAKHYVLRVRRSLELEKPFYDKAQRQRAELAIVPSFGRFKPDAKKGEPSLWRDDEFLVAQIDLDVYEKEPTVQAASQESGFLGERCNLYIWDDLATTDNSRSADAAEALAEWFEDEAESRLEPGGVGLLVGQRLNSLDLHQNRLEQKWVNENGDEVEKYRHIIYPAHFDANCPNGGPSPDCTQWDGEDEGCLLDEVRLGWRKLMQKVAGAKYRTLYQQESANPEDVLVSETWLTGGVDVEGYPALGCYDHERGFWEWPAGRCVTYACVDPSASKFWAVEVWALRIETGERFLVYGERRKMKAGTSNGFLDWDADQRCHVGLMEELQNKVGEVGQALVLWVVEANAAHRYLLQTNAYETWRRKWPNVKVIPHQTQKNKVDENFGVFAALSQPYKEGRKRLPRKKGDLRALTYLHVKEAELTKYPFHPTDDTVMADWFGEIRLSYIKGLAERYQTWDDFAGTTDLRPYLRETA